MVDCGVTLNLQVLNPEHAQLSQASYLLIGGSSDLTTSSWRQGFQTSKLHSLLRATIGPLKRGFCLSQSMLLNAKMRHSRQMRLTHHKEPPELSKSADAGGLPKNGSTIREHRLEGFAPSKYQNRYLQQVGNRTKIVQGIGRSICMMLSCVLLGTEVSRL